MQIGISVTCRRSTPVSLASLSPVPPRMAGRWLVPDHVIWVIGEPLRHTGIPFGRPGLRAVFFRSDLDAGLPSPAEDGGLLEFPEFCLTSAARSATCAASFSS